MKLLLNAGGPDRVSRAQMAETVAHVRGYDTSFIKKVSASSVSIYGVLTFNTSLSALALRFTKSDCFFSLIS